MWKSFKQIFGIIILLVAMLMLPVFVKDHSGRNKINRNASITPQSASTSNVLGVSTIAPALEKNDNSIKNSFFSNSKKYIFYVIEVLLVISVLSFIRFKYLKDKYGNK